MTCDFPSCALIVSTTIPHPSMTHVCTFHAEWFWHGALEAAREIRWQQILESQPGLDKKPELAMIVSQVKEELPPISLEIVEPRKRIYSKDLEIISVGSLKGRRIRKFSDDQVKEIKQRRINGE